MSGTSRVSLASSHLDKENRFCSGDREKRQKEQIEREQSAQVLAIVGVFKEFGALTSFVQQSTLISAPGT